MKLSQIKTVLREVETMGFQLPNGELVPSHFHVTEVGKITKHFMDCGGTERLEQVVNFQLWNADDYDHKLQPQKLSNIIELSEDRLDIGDLEIEVEYQAGTIGKFGLEFDGQYFLLTKKQTDCLAKENCGIPDEKPPVQLQEAKDSSSPCTPGGGCC